MDFLSLYGSGGQQRNQQQQQLLILFVSTTGDAEQTSSIQKTWSRLLSKSLPKTLFANVKFALFALGDRAYGPDAFCAAGRKLAARLAQLGGQPVCCLGYGDDGSPNGGVFADLDVWLEKELFPVIEVQVGTKGTIIDTTASNTMINLPYDAKIIPSKSQWCEIDGGVKQWQKEEYAPSYCNYFHHSCPPTAYQYNQELERIRKEEGDQQLHENTAATKNIDGNLNRNKAPLLGRVTVNDRITAEDWMQCTRHIKIHVMGTMPDIGNDHQSTSQQHQVATNNDTTHNILPYQAGDIATIMPSNPSSLVERFLSLLPSSIRTLADDNLHIQKNNSHASTGTTTTINHPWPKRCTLRGLLTHCADIQSLPEREDLYALSAYCNLNHPSGQDQRDKLISLSETSGAALYGDYIIREKRCWVDVFYDFDSICWEKKDEGEGATTLQLTLSHLLALLPSIAPRHFSIASSPSYMKLQSPTSPSVSNDVGFELELCVAIVQGTTPLGRSYTGCCSKYLASITPSKGTASPSTSMAERPDCVRLWIHPGSFAKLPVSPSIESQGDAVSNNHQFFKTPVMYVGAGTGIAPLRSLILEREAQRLSCLGESDISTVSNGFKSLPGDDADNILVFGCRKKAKDYYYSNEWEDLTNSKRLRVIPAFSRDQKHKLYVQRALREASGGELIVRHILERQGAVYIAGGSKMARAVKDEIVEGLSAVLDGGEKDAKKLLNKLKRAGLFSIEAWS